MSVKKRSHWLDTDDDEAIAKIREVYGLQSVSQAVRLAVRLVADSPKATILPTPHELPPISPAGRRRRVADTEESP